MSIQVTCPSCLSRFQVSDKFAGQSGPCPKCKKPIKIPERTDEVVIHAPRDDSPKDSKGRSVLKPIKRTETKVTRTGIIVTAATVLGLLIAAAAVRFVPSLPNWVVAVVGAILVAPPAIYAGYAFARDAELEPFAGADLRNRILVLTPILALLWLLYAYIPVYLFELDAPSEMSLFMSGVMIVVVLAAGTFAAANTLDLEISGGLSVAGLYVVSVLVLALIAGIPLASLEAQPERRERELLIDSPPAETAQHDLPQRPFLEPRAMS